MLYVVFVAVENGHNDDWFRWMRDEHIADVLATGCFTDATFVRDPLSDTETKTAYRILYQAHSELAFDRYQKQFGEELRADHTDRFGEVTVARRELLPIVIRLEAN